MMTIRPGDFWVADIPFTDGSASKKRPVLVLWLDGDDAVVAAVTSAAPRTPTDVLLGDWRASGLRVPSTARLSRLDCLEQSLLVFRLGHVSPADAQRLRDVWTVHIRLQF
jgi:mRNA interferase MazF